MNIQKRTLFLSLLFFMSASVHPMEESKEEDTQEELNWSDLKIPDELAGISTRPRDYCEEFSGGFRGQIHIDGVPRIICRGDNKLRVFGPDGQFFKVFTCGKIKSRWHWCCRPCDEIEPFWRIDFKDSWIYLKVRGGGQEMWKLYMDEIDSNQKIILPDGSEEEVNPGKVQRMMDMLAEVIREGKKKLTLDPEEYAYYKLLNREEFEESITTKVWVRKEGDGFLRRNWKRLGDIVRWARLSP